MEAMKGKLTRTFVTNFCASEFFSRQLNALRFSLKTSWLNPAAKYKFALYGLMTCSRATDSFQSSIFILSVFVNIRMSLGNMTIFGRALGMPMGEGGGIRHCIFHPSNFYFSAHVCSILSSHPLHVRAA